MDILSVVSFVRDHRIFPYMNFIFSNAVFVDPDCHSVTAASFVVMAGFMRIIRLYVAAIHSMRL